MKKVIWAEEVTLGTRFFRGTRTLAIGVQETAYGFSLIAVEGPSGATRLHEILDDHAHRDLGMFKSLRAAKAAGVKFARAWEKGAAIEACACAPIQGVPAIESSARRDGDG